MEKEYGVFYKSYSCWNKIAEFDNLDDAKACAELLRKGNPDWTLKVTGTVEIYERENKE